MARLATIILAGAVLGVAVAGACSSDRSGADGPPDAAADAPVVDVTPDVQSDANVQDATDAHSIVDAGLSPEHAWLADGSIWKPVAAVDFLQGCSVYEASGSATKFAPIAWKSCGPGCEEADPVGGLGSLVSSQVVSVHRLDGSASPVTAMEYGLKTAGYIREAHRFVDLRTGSTLAAFQRVYPASVTKSPCSSFRQPETALFTGIVGNGFGLPAIVEVANSSLRWIGPELPIAQIPTAYWALDIDVGPRLFAITPGTVWGLLDPTQHVWSEVESGSNAVIGSGEGDLAIWLDYPSSTSARIRGWRPDGLGVRTLAASVPPTTRTISLSPTRVVGFMADDPSGYATVNPKLWHGARSDLENGTLQITEIDLAPIAPLHVAYSGLRTWADHVVLEGLDPTRSTSSSWGTAVAVVELTTGKLWLVKPSADHGISNFTPSVDGSHLYFGEWPAGTKADRVVRLVRLDLKALGTAPNVTPL